MAVVFAAGLPPRREDDSIVDADAVVVVAINKTKRSARLQTEMIILEFIIVACVVSWVDDVLACRMSNDAFRICRI